MGMLLNRSLRIFKWPFKIALSFLSALCRVWQTRRVVITKTMLSFAFVDQESQIDHIPLAEVIHVKEMQEAAMDDKDGMDNQAFAYVMQIATNEDGYNSGRTYYLATESKESLDELMGIIGKLARKARLQAEARTWLRKVQFKVRQRYDSGIFQATMAVRIAAVRAPAQRKSRPGPLVRTGPSCPRIAAEHDNARAAARNRTRS